VFALVCVLTLAIAGCGGGGSSGGPSVANEDSLAAGVAPAFVPADGEPLADGQASVLAVDGSLLAVEEIAQQGQLQFAAKPGSSLPLAMPRFVVTSGPEHGDLQLDEGSGAFTYIPDENFFGSDTFNFYVIAAGLGSQQGSVDVAVENVNDAPELNVEFQAVVEQGREYRLALQATDADQDNLVYSASNLPGWMNFNSSSGLVLGSPEQFDVGIYRDIRFFVTDEAGVVAEAGPFALEVLDINDSPTVNADQFPSVLDAGENIVVNLFPDGWLGHAHGGAWRRLQIG